MYSKRAKQIKKTMQILENTFEANNLKVLNVSVRACADDDADCYVYVELATINGTTIPNDVYLKVNLYDEDDEVFSVNSTKICESDFHGYDTISISCYRRSSTLIYAAKGKLYAVKSLKNIED